MSLGVGKGDGTDLSLQIWLADKKIGEWTLKNPDHVKVREREREREREYRVKETEQLKEPSN